MKIYELTYQKNIRDLGGMTTKSGKTIKYGCLYRGGLLNKVTDEDIKVIDSFHLTDIVDFRSSDEYNERHDYPFTGVTFHNFSAFESDLKKEEQRQEDGNLLWFIDKGNDGFTHLAKTYRQLVDTPQGIVAYKKFFELILQDNKVTYFHCSQGKDRAGVAAFLIEIALGVSLKDAIDDYMLSNKAMEIRLVNLMKQVENKPFFNEQYKQSMRDVFSAKKEYIQEVIDIINAKYGGFDNYFKDVLKIDVNRLKELYLQ